jgi:hypothetical protein
MPGAFLRRRKVGVDLELVLVLVVVLGGIERLNILLRYERPIRLRLDSLAQVRPQFID